MYRGLRSARISAEEALNQQEGWNISGRKSKSARGLEYQQEKH
ncbi:hypothetical protein [Oceanobacillus arenosus]|nr:hypothetical protein [Oceanobacillus arenosus]